MDINFNVSKQTISTNVKTIVCGAKKYYKAIFNFDEEYNVYTKTVTFTNGDISKSINPDQEQLIPWEVIEKYGELKVAVRFDKDDVTFSTAAMEKAIRVTSKGKTVEDESTEHTPDWVQQVISMVSSLTKSSTYTDILFTLVGQYFESHKDEMVGETGVPGYTPVKGIDYWTDEDIKQIQSYIDNQIGGVLNASY